MRIVPRTLGARLAMILVLSIVGAQVAALAIFAQETTRISRAAIRTRATDQVETLVRVIDAFPPGETARILSAFDSPRHRYAIADASLVPVARTNAEAADLARHLRNRLGPATTQVRLALVSSPGARTAAQFLQMSVGFRNGRWLNGLIALPASEPPWVRIVPYQIAASVIAVLLVVALTRRGIVGPVAALAFAAEKAGRGIDVPALRERGPRELRLMTAAFNEMQERQRTFVADRTRMLAAIGHDLRTPIASLWLRAEMIEEAELREAMVDTLREMRAMVDATLSFARTDATAPPACGFDLVTLVRSVTDQYRMLGADVSLAAPASLALHGRPTAMRQAIDNLVSNADRYGHRVTVTVTKSAARICVRIEDDGPGIPDDRIEDMFKPFVRLDTSRSDATGGVGLGLAIARTIVREHGGDVSLMNRPGGGLVATVRL